MRKIMADFLLPPEWLKPDLRIVAFTGAGVSAESGIPTFRDPGGLWDDFDPQELATPEGFDRDPRRVLSWYAQRRRALAHVKPNPAHIALAQLQQAQPEMRIITQNIDGLHQAAGAKEVIELHGNLQRYICRTCRQPLDLEWVNGDEDPLPRCSCGGLPRPDVVWFGEYLPEEALRAAFAAAEEAELFLSIGTSTEVYPAAQLPFEALSHGAWVVEVNPEKTPLTARAHLHFATKAGEIVPRLVAEILNGVQT